MKNIIVTLMLLFVAVSAQAQETIGGAELSGVKKNKNAKYDIAVNGSCEMCKKRIEKAAYSIKGVKSADWNIDNHTLYIILNEEKGVVIDVKKAIAKVGHDTDEVKATEEEYNKLQGCCLYERE